MQAPALQPTFQDPFMYYKAFLDADTLPTSILKDVRQHDDSYTRHSEAMGAEANYSRQQQQARARPITYHQAIRLANHSNGAPLATIVEQGSYSTLNSRASLLSMGRIPSLRVAENSSPMRATYRMSHSLNDYALQRIREDAHREHDATAATAGCAELHERGRLRPIFDPTMPITSKGLDLPRSPGRQLSDGDPTADSRRSKGFFRGVLQNVRAASRTRSRSSSVTHGPSVEAHEDQPDACEYQQRNPDHILEERPPCLNNQVQRDISSVASTPVAESQARNRKVVLTNTPASASAVTYPPLLESSLPLFEPDLTSDSVPHLLRPSSTTHSRERVSSVRLVPQEPRDVAHSDGATTGAATFSNECHHSSSSPRHTFHGALVPRLSASSLSRHDRARETSRSVSFGSTMSTSYSGTVLGVDLDLQYEAPQQARHSSSPMPRQASLSASPESKQATDTEATRRSVTSSALTSLLPIAAATGIVQPNYNTPKISFYSPSGNLIQPEGSSSPETSTWEYGGPPTAPRLYSAQHGKGPEYRTLTATTCLPPARPTLVPMTTPPTSTAPLPPHLQHHHNYRRPEKSQISACESRIAPGPGVKGCGGVVRSHSISPRSHTRHFHHQKFKVNSEHKRRRSTRSALHDLKGDVSFYKSRYIALAARYGSTSPQKSKAHVERRTLYKRHTTGVKERPTAHAHTQRGPSEPRARHAAKLGTKTRTTHDKKTNACSKISLPGHALRICYCQPYDGAEKLTPRVASCTGDEEVMHPRLERGRDRQGERDIEGDNEPATRVVRTKKHQQGATRKHGSAMTPGRRKIDSAASRLTAKTIGV
ncbi:hypothetical protein FB567DRAFT_487154 [Paraphoma chrysanthemicola]|uniref:Uncharacterized protein n=1 Tax=Paraphoma chrysanthemicola TaxID=798071 RepID=A0A8K0RGM1_9PLEO|nr:hypothetical protein FB567DRAFT_487154 [Paraphoma chrysanthemicola]